MNCAKTIIQAAKACAFVAGFAAVFGADPAQAGDIVVVVNPAATIGKEQLADIFLGRNTSSTPVDLPESSALRASFYSKVTGKEASQVKATWARLVFSGKAQQPKELPDAAAVKKAVAADPKTVGYIDKSAVDASVKVLATLD